jgi:peptidoglycan/xylan/chitin deacetylase (PgdA/CDA1 family)
MRTLRHAAAAAIVAFLVLAAASSARAAPAPTRVSIEFDDGWAGAYDARTTLKTYGMKATYYIASGLVGGTGSMTWPQVAALAQDGHEIGGHTIDHLDLTSLSVGSMRHQVCDDRVALADRGYLTTSFAYPYGAFNSDAEQIASECGYNSARLVSGLRQNSSCTGCPAAEPTPPPDPFATRTFGSITADNSVADVKAWLTEAERNGNAGWVQLIFHNICTSGCGLYAWTPAQLSQLLSWIKGRSSLKVQTVNAVVGGAPKPVLSSMRPAPFHNSSLENDQDTDGTPDCWEKAGWGTNNPAFARTHDAFAGDWAERLDVTDYSSGNRKLLTERTEACAIKVTAGHTYGIGAWYKSTAPVAVEIYTQNAGGGWDFWTASPTFAAKAGWEQASVVTPPVPAGVTKLAFGLSLGANGSVTTDAWGFGDTAGTLRTSIANPSLEDGGSQPDCWEAAGWGTNTPVFARTSDAFAGAFAERLTLSDWVSGDRKLLTGRDGNCRIAATPAHAYQLSGWYKASVAPTMWVYVHDTPTNTWEFWTSKTLTAADGWTQGAFTTPEIPAGKDAIAFGIGLDRNGTLTTDAYNIADAT